MNTNWINPISGKAYSGVQEVCSRDSRAIGLIGHCLIGKVPSISISLVIIISRSRKIH